MYETFRLRQTSAFVIFAEKRGGCRGVLQSLMLGVLSVTLSRDPSAVRRKDQFRHVKAVVKKSSRAGDGLSSALLGGSTTMVAVGPACKVHRCGRLT